MLGLAAALVSVPLMDRAGDGYVPPPDPHPGNNLLLESGSLLLLENGIDAILLEAA